MIKILKTIDWYDCRSAVLSFAEKQELLHRNEHFSNFAEFLMALPQMLQPYLFADFCGTLQDENFPDVTEKALVAENASLFIHSEEDKTAALEIALLGEKMSNGISSWYLLDDEKKAAVNFIRQAGVVQMRMFCEYPQEFSVLHLLEINGAQRAVPVVFTSDFSYCRYITNWKKSQVLRKYLPREQGDLLSKKRYCSQPKQQPAVSCLGIDNGDML